MRLLTFFCFSLCLVFSLSGCKKDADDSAGEEANAEAEEAERLAAQYETWTDPQKALRMGEKLGLAALGNAQGMSDLAENIRGEAQILADQLELGPLPPFEPTTGEQAADDAGALHYILKLAPEAVEEKLNGRAAGLGGAFTMGIRAQTLMIVWLPGDIQDTESLTMSVLLGVTGAGKDAGLSEEFLMERLKRVGHAADFDVMKTELQVFLDDSFTELGK